MKARVKATGEIVDGKAMVSFNGELEVIQDEPDYWERLKHQCAGMAMQGMVERGYKTYIEHCNNYGNMEVDDAKALFKDHADALADICVGFATALIEKLKSESNEK